MLQAWQAIYAVRELVARATCTKLRGSVGSSLSSVCCVQLRLYRGSLSTFSLGGPQFFLRWPTNSERPNPLLLWSANRACSIDMALVSVVRPTASEEDEARQALRDMRAAGIVPAAAKRVNLVRIACALALHRKERFASDRQANLAFRLSPATDVRRTWVPRCAI